MQAIRMSIYGVKDVTRKEQLDFVHKMYTYSNYNDKPKLGVFEKFANSIGYKPLDWHYSENGLIEEKVKSPKEYNSPLMLLIDKACFFNEKNELLSFVVEIKDIKHSDSKYNYNTLDMMLKFQEFVYKIYSSFVRIEFKFIKDATLTLRDWLLSYFYTTVAMGEVYDTECSLPRMLTKKEKKYILNVISKYVSYKPDVKQFYCETCAENDKNRPYHTCLVDIDCEKEYEQEAIKEGWLNEYLKECS